MYEHIDLNKADGVVKLLRGIYPLITSVCRQYCLYAAYKQVECFG